MERKRIADRWANWRAALVARTFYAMLRDPKRSKSLSVEDFMPREPRKPQPWQEQLRAIQAWQALSGSAGV